MGSAPEGTPTPAEEVAILTSPPSTDTPTPSDTVTPTIRATSSPTASPTNTPMPTRTITPTPPNTPTPTPAPTEMPIPPADTSTPTPTYTPEPLTETPTPSPTYTPTPIPPTATSKPVAESGLGLTWGAVVDAPGGIVTMRSGPGDECDKIHDLPDGTLLEVMRRVHYKDDWIKVAANPDTDERIEGYVNIASGLIKVNIDLGAVPPIYEFGPRLLEPRPSAHFALEDLITFTWEDYGVLEENQYYSLIVFRDDLSEEEACYHSQHKVSQVVLRPKDYGGCTPGIYYWGVSVATKLSSGAAGEPIWRDDSERDHRSIVGFAVVPPDAGDSGDSGDEGEGEFHP